MYQNVGGRFNLYSHTTDNLPLTLWAEIIKREACLFGAALVISVIALYLLSSKCLQNYCLLQMPKGNCCSQVPPWRGGVPLGCVAACSWQGMWWAWPLLSEKSCIRRSIVFAPGYMSAFKQNERGFHELTCSKATKFSSCLNNAKQFQWWALSERDEKPVLSEAGRAETVSERALTYRPVKQQEVNHSRQRAFSVSHASPQLPVLCKSITWRNVNYFS